MTDQYEDWHPQQKVAQAAEQLTKARTGSTFTDEERARYRELMNRRRDAHRRARERTPQQKHLADHYQQQTCPADSRFNHWIPPSETLCVRGCGLSIIEQEALI